MKHFSWKLLASAVLSTMAATSGAAPVTLETMSFDEQGGEASNNGVPVQLGSVLGIYFSNAFVFDRSMIGQVPANGNNPEPDLNGTRGGFVVNSSQTSNAGAITLSLLPPGGNTIAPGLLSAPLASPTPYNGPFFQSVAMRLFAAGDVTVRGFSAGVPVPYEQGLSGASVMLTWSGVQTLDIPEAMRIDTLQFTAGRSGLSQFGFDDLSITLTSSGGGGGGNVPEPASYALVGLALLAAGAASRRKPA